ncbi:MAG: glycoside hydrolase family 65 [Aristaeellaceae bacterium]
MIERKEWVSRHNPVLTAARADSPLTVGNGDFAFTADITGMQTLYREYAAETPLCTMSNWGWHTIPADTPTGKYTLDDVQMNRYAFCGREVTYAKTKFPGNGHVYDWLRVNPHKLNLARIGLRLDGAELAAADFTDIRQELHLYSGLLESRYLLRGTPCRVMTACAPDADALAFRMEADLLTAGLTVDMDLPYGAPDITGADWNAADRHRTALEDGVIRCEMDGLRYAIRVNAPGAEVTQVEAHRIRIASAEPVLEMAVSFAWEEPASITAADIFAAGKAWWAAFWEQGGAIDLSHADDPRAMELERRIVLSLYLLAVNSSGQVPPAETGLTCNSWYGKAHLEMHFWHMAWAPLWGHGKLLERCLPWYHAHLPEARANAARNGYRGARWPKMVADDAQDSPSPIAVLLVWQQPHIIVMLEMLRRTMEPARRGDFLREHWPLIRETADFMADYAVRDEQGVYHIEPPVIPVQERYAPEDTRDPSFEVAYWKFGLQLAVRWAEDRGEAADTKWRDVAAHMALPPMHGGLYTAHASRPDTFDTMAEDHPSMLQCLGMLPGEDIDPAAMTRTLKKVLDCWNENSLWGWDFAVMAMTAARLGQPGQAIDLLLRETNKNTYVISGNNRQVSRSDLPLYLPGNGSLLLAAAMLASGWQGSAESPGFDQERGWRVKCEGLYPCF